MERGRCAPLRLFILSRWGSEVCACDDVTDSAWVEAKLQQELRADRLPACLIVGKVESRDNIPPGVTECMSRFVHVYESVARMYAESEVDATRASACENATRASVYDAMRASECDATRASVNNAMRANVSRHEGK